MKRFEQFFCEKIVKVDDNEYAVYPKRGGKRLGTHDTKKDAVKQLAAIEISKKEKKGINEDIKKEDIDFTLPRGEEIVLKAEDKDYDRGLLVELLKDGGYEVAYWYGKLKPYPIEVLVDGKSVKKDAKKVTLKFHPELKESIEEAKWSQKYKDSIDCDNPKGFSQKAHCQGKKKKLEEVYKDSGLGKWFGKGGEGGTTKGGWDRYNTQGDKIGKCGDAEKGEGYAACLSAEKAKKLGKEGRAKFVKRKRAAQKKAGDPKKGKGEKGETKKSKKPTYVKTGASEKRKKLKEALLETKRIPKTRKNQDPDTHSDLYTDENPKGTIHGLKFATETDAKRSVKKIENSGKKHAHKIQAAVAMEQRAKAADKSGPAKVYRSYIEKMKEKTKKMQNENHELSPLTQYLIEGTKNVPTDPELWSRAKSAAKKKFDVYPSAYANAWAAKWYKKRGGGWKKETKKKGKK